MKTLLTKIVFFIAGITILLSCSEIPVDKSSLLGFDFRLFQGTPVWEMVKAISRENCDKIKYWVQEKGAPIDFQEEKFGQTPLMIAILRGKTESVKTLLALGANPNIHDKCGETPLISAVRYCNHSWTPVMVEMLLKYGADPNDYGTTADNGRTVRLAALQEASEEYISIDVMRLLVEAGADVNYEDRAFGNLATLAIVHDRYDKAMFLLENGCRFDHMHESGVPHIIRILKHDIFAPESEKYKEKKAVVEWLRARGMEYHNFPGEFLKEKHRKIWEDNPEEWQRWVEYDRNL